MLYLKKHRRLIALLASVSICLIFIFVTFYRAGTKKEIEQGPLHVEDESEEDILQVTDEPPKKPEEIKEEDPGEIVPDISKEEIELLALLTMAEAEGEPDEGKRLVIDTVLNRVDSPHFPDTIYDVIYQKNQFSSVWNGRLDRCYVDEDILQLVTEELESRTNSEVIYFRTQRYSEYGKALFQVGNHYFSSQ